jgi:hypothetical protein
MKTNFTCFISKFLNTNDLTKLAKQDVNLRKYYLGTYAADVTPKTLPPQCCWIWNVDESDKPGTHWVAIVKDQTQIYFFDSYAKTPTFYKRQYWLTYFHDLGYGVTLYNEGQKQSYVSRTCGVWCLLFLKAYWEENPVVHTFQNNKKQLINNERRLKTLSFTQFPSLESLYRRKCNKAKGQICKTYIETYFRNK